MDEYQDVNPLQERIIWELYGLCGNICVVGDDDQTIYQWRGSDVQNIISFSERYPNVETIPLNCNFRSSTAIVEAARQFIEQVPARLTKAMESFGAQPTESGDLLALSFGSPQEEANWVVTEIRRLYGSAYRDKPDSEERGLTYSDVAILLRSVRNDARPFTQALDNAGIPYIVNGMDGLFETPEIQAMREVFFYLTDFAPSDQDLINHDSLRTILRHAGLGLSDNQLDAGLQFLDERKGRIHGEMQAELYLQRLYLDFLQAIQLREELVDEDATNSRSGEIIYYNLGKFSSVISDFEQINFHTAPADLYSQFANFLHYQAHEYYPEGWEEGGLGRPDAVQIITVHKAKGMQVACSIRSVS